MSAHDRIPIDKLTAAGVRVELIEQLLDAGIPVIAVGPNDAPRQSGWQSLSADDCDLSLFRRGDALGMVCGHGIDIVDVDTKDGKGGSVDHLPPFARYGMTTTPSGGMHFVVPSCGLGKISPLHTASGFVGDYAGGRPDGSGRMLAFLPGSVRTKYPNGGYVEEVLWDVAACLAAEPEPALVRALEKPGAGAEQPRERYVDDSPPRDPALGPDPYAAAAVEQELALLDECDLLGYSGEGWDNTTYAVACNLIEFGKSAWTGYDLDGLHERFLDRAPTDEAFGPKNHQDKWDSALNMIGNGGRRSPRGTPQDDFDPVSHPLFDATPTLAHIRRAAHSRMVSAPALLCYVLGRVLAELPPGVDLPPTIGGPAPLNMGIAVVGESGAGKTALMSVSRELLGLTGAFQEDIERNVGSGEGLVMSFLEWSATLKRNVLIDDPRRILNVDEVDSLGATQSRNGSTIAATIRTAVSGGSLGQENAAADRRRHVKANSYRLVLLIGVQPTRSATLLNDDRAGTPQRLLWVRATDPTIPSEPVPWPGLLHAEWGLPRLPEVIDYPDRIKGEVRAARLVQTRGGPQAANMSTEGHKLLTRLKVAAAFALLHGEAYISDQWWGLAGLLVDDSMAVQEECRQVLMEEARKQTASRARSAGHAAVITAEVIDADRSGVDRASKTIMKKVEEAGQDGISWGEVRVAIQHKDREQYAMKARHALEAGGLLRVEDVTVGKRSGERLWLTP